jgi:hypothetical protein
MSKSLRAAALLCALAAIAVPAASPATAGVTFPSAVEQVLLNQHDGPISRLDARTKRELIACVNDVLAGLPDGKKRFVAEAASYDELEDRFGKVVMENRAEWKQKIARGCAHIVV